MFQMSGPSLIMLNDERVLVRREDATLGDSTIVVAGKRVKRGYIEFAVDCNVQPVSGDDLIMVPEGDRFNDQMFCFVADSQTPIAPNDLICRLGDGWYQVQMCEGWGSYTRARMQKVDVGPLKSVSELAADDDGESPPLLLR